MTGEEMVLVAGYVVIAQNIAPELEQQQQQHYNRRPAAAAIHIVGQIDTVYRSN